MRVQAAAVVGAERDVLAGRIPIQIVERFAVLKDLRLSWQKRLVTRAYQKDIRAAQLAKDQGRVESLKHDQRFELVMLQEEEDVLFTCRLLRQANRLRVPIPSRYSSEGQLADDWEETQYLGALCLTDRGVSKLREEIRREVRWRHEQRAHWIAWLSAITGVVGAFTGLIAVLYHR